MSEYRFTPPVVAEAPVGPGRLFSYYKMNRGVTVLVTDGVVSEVRFPSQEEIDAADYAYIGGHEYVISADEAAVLTAAGYEPVEYDPLGE